MRAWGSAPAFRRVKIALTQLEWATLSAKSRFLTPKDGAWNDNSGCWNEEERQSSEKNPSYFIPSRCATPTLSREFLTRYPTNRS